MSNQLPVYIQIHDQLKNEIEQGIWKVGDRLPSEITESLYRTLEEKGGKKIGPANQTITAVLASEKIADYLEVKRGDAVLRLRQISYFEDGTPFEYVRTQYVGNRFEFYLEK
ncbi:UTRA domain-containing protein [Enterococcus faecium]|uniref:UTRA domain-containing protein n=1 Tax=Enterococcus faecium TaxID=1352 RepID=UPI0038B4A4CB